MNFTESQFYGACVVARNTDGLYYGYQYPYCEIQTYIQPFPNGCIRYDQNESSCIDIGG
jgi:hypothetical protein